MLAVGLLLVGAPDVQRMIDEAKPGAVIELPAGELVADLRIKGGITLRGAGMGKTTLRGTGKTSVVRVDAIEGTVRLEHLSITGGHAMLGGGIFLRGSAALFIEDVEIFGNEATSGGAIAINDAPATLRRVVIRENRAMIGGGIGVGGKHPISIQASRLVRNSGQNVGGLTSSAERLELADVTFEENVSERGDAAHASMWCEAPGCSVVLDAVRFGPARSTPVELGQGPKTPKVSATNMKWPL